MTKCGVFFEGGSPSNNKLVISVIYRSDIAHRQATGMRCYG